MALTQVDSGLLGTNAQYTGFKNRIINGAMGIWQRGTSGFTTIDNYSADRWIIRANTSLSTGAQSSDVPTGFPYSISVSGTGYAQVKQRIESVNCTDLASQNVTISFWLKQTSGAGAASVFLQLFYANSANSFGTTTQIGSTATFTGTSGWVQYIATFTSISANAVNGLELVIGANTGSAASFLITGVQLEKGSTATSFDYRPYGTELVLCQRYYSTIAAITWTTVPPYQTVQAPVPMRTAPTMTTTFSSGTGAVYSNISTTAQSVYQSNAHSSAQNAYINFSAEL